MAVLAEDIRNFAEFSEDLQACARLTAVRSPHEYCLGSRCFITTSVGALGAATPAA